MSEWPGSRIIRERVSAERGAARRLALALGRNQSVVNRWAHGARPDPAAWPEIEEALGLPPGTLAGVDGVTPSDEVAALRQRVEALEAELRRLAAHVATLGAATVRATRPDSHSGRQSP